MENLEYYVILPINEDDSKRILTNGFSGHSNSDITNVSANVEYMISQNSGLGNDYVNPPTSLVGPYDESNETTLINNAGPKTDEDESFDKCNRFSDHSKTRQGESSFTFKKCEKTLNGISLYQNHILAHDETLNGIMSDCGNNSTIHLFSNGDSLCCPICDLSFQRMASLKSHLSVHHLEEFYTCSECSLEFENEAVLKTHLRTHSKEVSIPVKELICNYCKIKFRTPAMLKKHISSHIKVKKLVHNGKKSKKYQVIPEEHKNKCTVCNKTFPKLSLLERHLRIHSGERPFLCTLCDKGFTQKGSLQIHLMNHSGSKPYCCTLCPAKFSQKGNLKVHVRKTHTARTEREKIFKCSECDCIFKKVASLNGHMTKIHATDTNEITITSVIDQLKTLDELKSRNITSVNTKSILNVDQFVTDSSVKDNDDELPEVYSLKQKFLGTTKFYVCSFCNKETKKPSDMIRHLRTHTKHKPFKCYCGNSFSLKSTLLSHMQTHKEKTERICSVCSKEFFSMKAWMSHIRTHDAPLSKDSNLKKTHHYQSSPEPHRLLTYEKDTTLSEKPWNCQVCPASFMKKVSLDHHSQLHSREKNYKCLKCPRIFVDANALNRHMKLHDGSYNFSCEICDEKSSSKSSLMRNQIIHKTLKPYECPHCKKMMIICSQHIDIHRSECEEQPNDTMVLDSLNRLEQYTMVFNECTIDDEVPNIDIMQTRSQSYILPDTMTNTISNPSKSTIWREIQKIVPTIEINENCLQDIISPNLLSSVCTKTSLDNSTEIDSFQINSIASSEQEHSEGLPQTKNYQNLRSLASEELQVKLKNLSVIQCLVCSKQFDNLSLLQSHACSTSVLKKDINDIYTINNEAYGEDTDKRFEEAETSSKSKKISSNSVKKPYDCVHCGKKFNSSTTYVRHINTHRRNGDGFHGCKFCEKEFKKPSDLSRHLRTHTGEKPFACGECDKKFTLKSTLEGHYRTHNPVSTKDFLCEVCNSFFSSKSSRKLHMLIHTGVKPHKCSYCDQYFRTAAHKGGHEKKVHFSKRNADNRKKKITDILAAAAADMVVDISAESENPVQKGITASDEIQLDIPNVTMKPTVSVEIDPAFLI